MLRASSVYHEPVLVGMELVTEYRPEEESSTELAKYEQNISYQLDEESSRILDQYPKDERFASK